MLFSARQPFTVYNFSIAKNIIYNGNSLYIISSATVVQPELPIFVGLFLYIILLLSIGVFNRTFKSVRIINAVIINPFEFNNVISSAKMVDQVPLSNVRGARIPFLGNRLGISCGFKDYLNIAFNLVLQIIFVGKPFGFNGCLPVEQP